MNQTTSTIDRVARPETVENRVETILIIVVIVLLLGGGGYYGRGRWYCRALLEHLALIDDWGPDRLSASNRRDLMEIVEDRYGRGSILIASQLPVATWLEVIAEPTLGDAILDRIVHNAYGLELDGPSMRKIKAGEDVSPASSPATAAEGKSTRGAKK